MVAIAAAMRAASTELDDLAGALPAWDLGAARRKVRAIVLGIVGFADGFTLEGSEP